MDMGLEDVCDTGLVLGSGCEGKRAVPKLDRQHASPGPPIKPSLTLGLSDYVYASAVAKTDTGKGCTDARLARQSSTQSTISSFSNACPSIVERKKEVQSEAAEAERTSSRISDDEDGGARKKLRLTKEQSALLEDRFKEHSTLNPKQKQALAKQLNLRTRQVEVWFQNRRARTKLKQTEMDCEFLKKCCETLTDENRRLQKELQELKAFKFTAPTYMQLPAATVIVCPSCKRIAGANDDTKSGPFNVPQKPQFVGPFAHSASC